MPNPAFQASAIFHFMGVAEGWEQISFGVQYSHLASEFGDYDEFLAQDMEDYLLPEYLEKTAIADGTFVEVMASGTLAFRSYEGPEGTEHDSDFEVEWQYIRQMTQEEADMSVEPPNRMIQLDNGSSLELRVMGGIPHV